MYSEAERSIAVFPQKKGTERPLQLRSDRKFGLVAEACGYGDLVAALGAATAQYGGPGFGSHADQEAVYFRAAAAVGLECALRHKSDSC